MDVLILYARYSSPNFQKEYLPRVKSLSSVASSGRLSKKWFAPWGSRPSDLIRVSSSPAEKTADRFLSVNGMNGWCSNGGYIDQRRVWIHGILSACWPLFSLIWCSFYERNGLKEMAEMLFRKEWSQRNGKDLPSKVTGNRDIYKHGTLPSSGFLGGEHLCFLGWMGEKHQ